MSFKERTDQLLINGMSCASCVATIEKAINNLEGVSGSVNFATKKATITYNSDSISVEEIAKKISETGYVAMPIEGGHTKQFIDHEKEKQNSNIHSLKVKTLFSMSFSIPLMLIAMGPGFGLGLPSWVAQNNAWIQWALTTPVIMIGYQFFTKGFMSVLKHKRANMDTLVGLGVGAAYLYSLVASVLTNSNHLYYETAAFLIAFILLGRWLEAIAKGKTSAAIKSLMRLRAKTAIVVRDGEQQEISIDDVIVGDHILVKPGQKIPVDGQIVDGKSTVDESMVTGESMPVEKSKDAQVIGGTVNKSGSFTYEATHIGSDTMLSQIIKLVESAQGSKAPIQKLADTIAAYFVPIVLIVAVIAFGLWLAAGQSFSFSLTIFISVLIISCPCALGLATPTAVMVGTGIAAKTGILIKSAEALQTAHRIDAIIFDKTGTLTRGKPSVTDSLPVNLSENDLLRLSASLDAHSEHPLAEAIVQAAKNRSLSFAPCNDFDSITGQGVKGRIENQLHFLGNRRLMGTLGISIEPVSNKAEALESQGKTVVFVSTDTTLLGAIAIADTIKDNSSHAINDLKARDMDIYMLTGDNEKTAQAIANQCGIQHVFANVLPSEKADKVKSLQTKGLKVAMVGDGINDAPALAQADIGIAMGAGTDIAMESADIVLIKDDLRDVVSAMDISGFTMRKIKQNLFWAFAYNTLGIPVAAGALYPLSGFLLNPMIAGVAMAFSSVSVLGNTLLMNRKYLN
ncbi:MAG: copper-translocating P-type ATPase [Candidatus Marinimicrobia bacterium]|nr:copper-translocating P-type ATPase [Candidatus Neomarinimicrobiota bacterium]